MIGTNKNFIVFLEFETRNPLFSFFLFFSSINLLNSALYPALQESDPTFFPLLSTDFKDFSPT